MRILELIYDDLTTPLWLREIPVIETLRITWIQQYWMDNGQLHYLDQWGNQVKARKICQSDLSKLSQSLFVYSFRYRTEKTYSTSSRGTQSDH